MHAHQHGGVDHGQRIKAGGRGGVRIEDDASSHAAGTNLLHQRRWSRHHFNMKLNVPCSGVCKCIHPTCGVRHHQMDIKKDFGHGAMSGSADHWP